MQPARVFLNPRAMPCEVFLHCSTNELGKAILFVAILQFFIELRRKHGQKFGIASEKRAVSVSRAEDDGVEEIRKARDSQNVAPGFLRANEVARVRPRNAESRALLPCRAIVSTHPKQYSVST
ncbi:MAG: hypothetical protein JWP08_326 [Bryobacterales bacterium]|nr:hypothetical protein [Bryobacterales bacterium]